MFLATLSLLATALLLLPYLQFFKAGLRSLLGAMPGSCGCLQSLRSLADPNSRPARLFKMPQKYKVLVTILAGSFAFCEWRHTSASGSKVNAVQKQVLVSECCGVAFMSAVDQS